MFGSNRQAFAAAVVGGMLLATAGISGGADTDRSGLGETGRKAPINHAKILGGTDRITDQSRLPSMESSAQVEIIGKKDAARIAIVDGSGEALFEMDPTRNLTVIMKGAVVPPMTVRDASGEVMELRISTEVGEKGDQPSIADVPSPQSAK